MHWLPELDEKKQQIASKLARSALEAAPDKPGSWIALSRVLISQGRFEDAVSCLRDAVAALPACAELRLALALALTREDFLDAAKREVEAALTLAPDNIVAEKLKYDLDAAMGSSTIGQTVLSPRAGLFPPSADVMQNKHRDLDPEKMLDYCEAQLAAHPGHSESCFYKALALAELGRSDEARDFLAIARLVEVGDLPVPAQFEDGAAFRTALEDEIRRNPTLSGDPRDKTTYDGMQTRHLRQPDAVAVEALVVLIKNAVDDYEKNLQSIGSEFLKARPKKVRLNPWAIVYTGKGFEKSHRHPIGWLSGVYYVTAPRPNGENAYRGPLLLGALDKHRHRIEPPWGVREIEPVPGRLVLFPSYVPHATRPCDVEGARISVAFDVISCDGPQ